MFINLYNLKNIKLYIIDIQIKINKIKIALMTSKLGPMSCKFRNFFLGVTKSKRVTRSISRKTTGAPQLRNQKNHTVTIAQQSS